VLSWLDGGISCYDNGCLLCRFHHTEVHKGFWKIKWGADGIPEFVPPIWVDPNADKLVDPFSSRRLVSSKK
jgi:hypothetical protein